MRQVNSPSTRCNCKSNLSDGGTEGQDITHVVLTPFDWLFLGWHRLSEDTIAVVEVGQRGEQDEKLQV